jgi:hypothetical protein
MLDLTNIVLLHPRKVVLSDTGNRAYEDVRSREFTKEEEHHKTICQTAVCLF